MQFTEVCLKRYKTALLYFSFLSLVSKLIFIIFKYNCMLMTRTFFCYKIWTILLLFVLQNKHISQISLISVRTPDCSSEFVGKCFVISMLPHLN